MSYASVKGYPQKPKPGVRIDPLHPLSRGLVGCWLFNEGAGSRLRDISGYSNHGVLTNMDPAADWVGSPRGGALDFDTDDQIDITKTPATDVGNTFTVMAWINTRRAMNTGTTDRQGIYSTRRTNDGGAWLLEIGDLNDGAANASFGISGVATWVAVASANSISPNRWHHIVAVKKGINATDTTLYANGVETGYDVRTAYTAIDSIDDPLLGGGTSGTQPLDGLLNDVRLYNRALSAFEIKQLYQDSYANILRAPIRRWANIIGFTPRAVMY